MNAKLAAVKAGVFPLIKKAPLQELAHKVMADLREKYSVQYDESGSIGRRYRRQDEAGTPFCMTADCDGGEADGPDTVSVRSLDDMSQERIGADKRSDYNR